MKALTYALALLAALRASRFVTSDWLGEWTVAGPVKRWAERAEVEAMLERVAQARQDDVWERQHGNTPTYVLPDGETTTDDPAEWAIRKAEAEGPITWEAKLAKGLDCPFCIGFWLTGAAVLAAAAANRGPRRRAVFQVLAGAFGANYITGHVSKRLDF
ncbi:hypothetical protein SEA_MEMENTOMORI_9 [Microbacterium phage MementoMori]|uniref:Uncharacterized protein n=1 Tax=Microbacterium phage MementoMori TaxID=2201436 RepID=A0A2Z4Q5I5_9CAUD|nr:hypothetical protein HOT41_gp09 [Microbacterium phage MementoMori]AWY05264.1 hypothetical protein SEA_MEMENTOMORI_9 [Microbacterium phage MementoMori]